MTGRARARFVLAAAAALAACSGKGDGGPHPDSLTVAVTPQTAALCVGDSLTFTAQVLDTAGHVVAGSPIRWSSSAPLMVSVDSVSGVARALAFGTAQITASAGGLRSATPGQLDVPSDLSPEFVPDVVVLAPLDTFTLGVRLRRLSAGPAPSRTPLLAPLDTTVASLDATGLLTAKVPGTATFSLTACGFTGHGAARVFTPPDSTTGLGYLWLGSPAFSFATVVWNFTLSSKKPAFQVFGSTGGQQFAYEDTLRLTSVGALPLDSLSLTRAASAQCNPPGPFAIYAFPTASEYLVSLRGGGAAVTTFRQRSGYAAIAGRVIGRLGGIVGTTALMDTFPAIYTFSAPLRDTATACP